MLKSSVAANADDVVMEDSSQFMHRECRTAEHFAPAFSLLNHANAGILS